MASNRTREPLRGAFIAILAAAIGAGGTLLGNQLASANAGQQLSVQLSHDDSVRQSELRRAVYAKFIAAASQYELDLERVPAIAANKGSLNEKEFRELTDDGGRLLSVSSEVQVVGSAKAASLAEAVRNDLDDILNLGLSGRLSPEEMNARANANERKLSLFVGAAHDELNK
jgi:hypothetical protein